MALIKCHECGNEISTEAESCPKCGAPRTSVTKVKSQSYFKQKVSGVQIAAYLFIAILFIVWLATRNPSSQTTAPIASAEAKQSEEDLDRSTKKVTSCDWNKIRDEIGDLKGTSWQDQAFACRHLANVLGNNPSIGVVRQICKMEFVLKVNGLKDDEQEIFHQAINVVEARNLKIDKEINETFNILVKVFIGSNGVVTPRDINIALRSIGVNAQKLSDDGLYHLAAVIQMEKKKAGY